MYKSFVKEPGFLNLVRLRMLPLSQIEQNQLQEIITEAKYDTSTNQR
ncbi:MULTISPECIES: hypothetical protein [unclassified Microcoleus]